jgi:hypothetical protein
MGWEALEQWGEDVARIERLTGGVANDVWSVRVNGHLAVGRLGARSDADLAWETTLLQHLDREGLRALLGAGPRGRGSSDARHASSMATPTLATSV